MSAVRIILSGHVQGVGMRVMVQRQARHLHLTGTVRNCNDGTVAIELQGPPTAIRHFIDWCNGGIPVGHNVQVQVYDDAQMETFEDFRIV